MKMKTSIESNHIIKPQTSYQDSSYLQACAIRGEKVILVDDFHGSFTQEDRDLILASFPEALIFWEASFENSALDLLSLLPVEIKGSKTYLKGTKIVLKKERVTCALLTASWYLFRLGYNSNLWGEVKLINFLPEAFKESENNTLTILNYFNLPSESIETHFYKKDDLCEYITQKDPP